MVKIKKPKTGILKKKIFKRENDENDINIDGKTFKPDDIKNIADAIFTKCGYYNKKLNNFIFKLYFYLFHCK